MKKQDFKSHYIRVAGITALIGNTVLAAMKLIVAYLFSSMALLGDGVDSTSDVLIAIVTLLISGIVSQPGDKEHPWGHGRAETTATMILSFVIFFAGAQLVIQSVTKIFTKNFAQETSLAAIITALISIAGKLLLSLVEQHFGKLADSEIVKANAANMRSDIILSSGVLIGLGASALFKCPILDPVIALVVGLWVIHTAVQIFNQINLELMDGNTDNSLYKRLFEAVSSIPGVMNPHRARIRKIASLFDVDLDIEVDPNMTVYCAHELSEQVEEAIRKEIPEIYDIMIHIEPAGSDNHQPQEKFGLTPESLKESEKKS